MWFSTILLALRSIRRNLMRSFLTILGIVIGVSAVITMVTLGNGATKAVQTQISSLGTNLLQVRPGALLEDLTHQHDVFRTYWPLANAESFQPVTAPQVKPSAPRDHHAMAPQSAGTL